MSHSLWQTSLCFLVSPTKLSIYQTLPNKVSSLHLMQPICCRVWQAMNLKWRSRPSFFAVAWKATFSPKLSHLIFSTTLFSELCSSCISKIMACNIWSFVFKNDLKLKSIGLSTVSSQYCKPLKLQLLTWLMLINSHLPGNLPHHLLLFVGVFLVKLGGGHSSHKFQTDFWVPSCKILHFLHESFGCMSKLLMQSVYVLQSMAIGHSNF